MFNKPRFGQVVLYAGAAIAAGVLSWYVSPAVLWLGALLAGGCFLFTASALVYLVYWALSERHAAQILRIDAENQTERVRVLEALTRMSVEQLDALMHANHLESVLTGIEPRMARVAGKQIPWLWLMDFTKDELWLPPIRDYHDGSKERDWAHYLIAPNEGVWVVNGCVRASKGNLHAAWLNRSMAMSMVEEE